jgi:hypothetical protein
MPTANPGVQLPREPRFADFNPPRSYRQLEYAVRPSDEFPEEFGYLLLRGQRVAHPIIVMPIIMRQLQRALSVCENLRSPFGTGLAQAREPLETWVVGCGRSVTAAIAAFGASLEQPKEVEREIEQLTTAPAYGLNARQKLQRMSAR